MINRFLLASVVLALTLPVAASASTLTVGTGSSIGVTTICGTLKTDASSTTWSDTMALSLNSSSQHVASVSNTGDMTHSLVTTPGSVTPGKVIKTTTSKDDEGPGDKDGYFGYNEGPFGYNEGSGDNDKQIVTTTTTTGKPTITPGSTVTTDSGTGSHQTVDQNDSSVGASYTHSVNFSTTGSHFNGEEHSVEVNTGSSAYSSFAP